MALCYNSFSLSSFTRCNSSVYEAIVSPIPLRRLFANRSVV